MRIQRVPIWAGLLFIVVTALFMRVWGIDNGLPYAQVTDETADISASLQIASGHLPPYLYIRTAWNLAQWSTLGPYYLYLRATDPGFSTAKFEELYFVRRGDFILRARLMTALLTTLAVIPMYLAGRSLSGSRFGGLLAALLLAVNPPTAYMAHVALSDNLAVCGVVIALLGAIWIAQSGTRWAYILGGLGASIAMLGHLQTYIVVIAVGMAHVIYWWWQPKRPLKVLFSRWLWAAGAFAISHVVLNPFIIIAPQAVLADINEIIGQRMGFSSLSERLTIARSNALDPILMMRPYLALAAAAGTLLGVARRNAAAVMIAIFGLVFSVSLLPAPGPRLTFWLPVAIPSILLATYVIVQLSKTTHRWSRWLAVALCLAMVAASGTELILMNLALARTNTRVQAYTYVKTRIAPGTKIMIGEVFTYSVPLARTEASIKRIKDLGQIPAPSYEFQLKNPAKILEPKYDVYGPETATQFKDEQTWWQYIHAEGIKFIVEADYCGKGPANFTRPSALEFPPLSQNAIEKLKLISIFSPFTTNQCQQVVESRTPMEYMRLGNWVSVGPIIRIYQVPDNEVF